MSGYQTQSAGLPYTYTSNPLYLQYMQQLQAQQQQAIQQYQAQQAQLQAQQAQLQSQRQVAQQTGDQYQSQDIQEQDAIQYQQPIQQQQYIENPNGCTDDADDGKISFGEKVKNIGKGIGNFFKGMFCDENGFSLSRTLITVGGAAVATALTIATGGAALPYMIAAGVAIGSVETGVGAYRAATAKTDAEAKLAWQQIGSGATTVIASTAGAKGALKGAGYQVPKGNWFTSSLKATGDCLKIAGKGTLSGAKAAIAHPMVSFRNVRGYYNNTVKPNLSKAFSYQTSHDRYLTQQKESLAKQLENVNKEITQVQQEMARTDIDLAKRQELHTRFDQLEAQQKLLTEQQTFNSDALARIENKKGLSESEIYHNNKINNRSYRSQMQQMEQEMRALKAQMEAATGESKATLKNQLQSMEAQYKNYAQQAKIEIAQNHVENADMHIASLKNELKKPGITEAQQETINGQIARLQKAVQADRQILRNQNALMSIKETLPTAAVPIMASQMGMQCSTDNLFANLNNQAIESYNNQIMQTNRALAEAQQESQQAYATQQSEDAQAQQQTQQSQITMPQITFPPFPVATNLDFDSLYVNPYPDVY